MENGDRPVTRAELHEELAKFKNEFKAEFKAELMAELDARDASLREFIRDNQTELLRAFHGFIEATRLRFLNLEQSRATSDSRLDNVEHRLDRIERRLLQDRVDPPKPGA